MARWSSEFRIGDDRRVADALADVATAARDQDWDADRPWRLRSHLWWEGGVLVVDLHDLKAGLARRAVQAVVGCAAQLETAAVVFVTGRGRHSIGRGVLPGVVTTALRQAVADNENWSFTPSAGRLTLVLDPARAPASATGRLGWMFWTGVAAFVVLAIWACLSGVK